MAPALRRSISGQDTLEQPVDAVSRSRHGHNAQSRSLMQVVMVELGDGHVELAQPVLDAGE